uniref:Histidine-containing phosphotransfer protein n=1 Tax=Kalanchoe fedtschenkoi TaxID=63787 RepID=A0A7N0ZRS5_KALFE
MGSYEELDRELRLLVKVMQEQGVLDEQFGIVQAIREINDPLFVVDLIPMFCKDAEAGILDMTKLLNQSVVNYHDLKEFCIKLKGSASMIGAPLLMNACTDLCGAIDHMSKERCMTTLTRIKHEYNFLKGNLKGILR